MSLIVKKILSGLVSALSAPAVDTTQYLVYLRFNSTLQLINGTLNNPPKMLKYFNSTAIIAFFRIPLTWFGAGWASVFSIII